MIKALGLAGFLMLAAGGAAAAQTGSAPATKPVADDVSADMRPPKGMCRIWLKDVPAKQQPAPTDCAAAVKNCPPTGRVIFGDTEESKHPPKSSPDDPRTPRKSMPVKPPVKTLIRKPPA